MQFQSNEFAINVWCLRHRCSFSSVMFISLLASFGILPGNDTRDVSRCMNTTLELLAVHFHEDRGSESIAAQVSANKKLLVFHCTVIDAERRCWLRSHAGEWEWDENCWWNARRFQTCNVHRVLPHTSRQIKSCWCFIGQLLTQSVVVGYTPTPERGSEMMVSPKILSLAINYNQEN